MQDDQIGAAFEQLMLEGYFNDESTGLGSYVVEHRLDWVEEQLRDVGYDGPKLAHSGKYYSNRGAVYWAYNPDRIDFDEASRLTDAWVQSVTNKG